MAHLDFSSIDARIAVHSMKSDGVELALVQVDHWQLVGFVRRSQGSSQAKLELTPESLWRGTSVGGRVDWAGLIIREGIAVGKSLKSTKKHKDFC